MRLVEKLLFLVPTIPLGFFIIVLVVGFSILGLAIVRHFVPGRFLKAHHELTSPIFQVVALAYTVLLAFVVVVSWQNYDKANSHIESEANYLVDLHRNSAAFPEIFRDQVQAAIKNYSNWVMNEEWKLMAKGEESMNARAALREIWDLYTQYEPKTEKEKAFFLESIGKLDDLREMRRLRIVETRTGVHPVLWFILISGGIATIGFAFFFGAESFGVHAFMVATLAMLIALIIFMVILFDLPFSGSMGIKPETFQQVIHF